MHVTTPARPFSDLCRLMWSKVKKEEEFIAYSFSMRLSSPISTPSGEYFVLWIQPVCSVNRVYSPKIGPTSFVSLLVQISSICKLVMLHRCWLAGMARHMPSLKHLLQPSWRVTWRSNTGQVYAWPLLFLAWHLPNQISAFPTVCKVGK